MIAVVIPYFQCQPRLLHRALSSIATQRVRPSEVLVVDDGSPAAAEPELEDLPSWLSSIVRILHQANRGAGAARNAALDAVSPDVKMIAFLDSDDAWREGHLANINAAAEAGAAFYFADHQRSENSQTRFAECNYRPDGPALTGAPDLAWCRPRRVAQAVIRRSPVGTSTVAISRDAVGRSRFPTSLRAAGEDSLFWLGMLSANPRVICSTALEAVYGRGVSIFNHRSWGDERALQTHLDEMRAQLLFRKHSMSNREIAAVIEARLNALDLGFWRAFIACARRGRWRGVAPSVRYISHRPRAWLHLPEAVAQALEAGRSGPVQSRQ